MSFQNALRDSISLMSLATAIGFSGSAAAQQQLIVNSYGGPYENIIQERIIVPFEKQFGVKVIYDAAGSASQDYAKIKASRGRPGFDVVVMTASQSLAGCKEGLLEKFNTTNVPNLAQLDRGISAMAGECGAVHEVQYLALLWNKDKLKQAPTSWSALEDSAYKGQTMLPSFGNIMATFLVQLMSISHGGTMTNVDPGFAAMAKAAPNAIAFEQSSAIMDKYMKEGRLAMMPSWSGRAQILKDEGAPIEYAIPKEGTIPLVATLNVPIGAENKKLAMQFVDYFLSKAGQEAWVVGYNVGSIRSGLDLPQAVRARQITTKADLEKLHLPDLEAVSSNMANWSDRFRREVVTAK